MDFLSFDWNTLTGSERVMAGRCSPASELTSPSLACVCVWVCVRRRPQQWEDGLGLSRPWKGLGGHEGIQSQNLLQMRLIRRESGLLTSPSSPLLPLIAMPWGKNLERSSSNEFHWHLIQCWRGCAGFLLKFITFNYERGGLAGLHLQTNWTISPILLPSVKLSHPLVQKQ